MKKLFFSISIISLIVLLLAGCTAPSPKEEVIVNQLKVGVVDQDRVWTESEKSQSYQQELNKKIKSIQDQYKDNPQELSEEEEIEKHQETYEQINRLKIELEEKFNKEIRDVVSKIAVEKELDVILNKEEVRYGGTDITDEVIKNLK